MPRLSPSLLRHAARVDRHLSILLKECRDLRTAQNELRWMKESILESDLEFDHQSPTLHHESTWRSSTSNGKKLNDYIRRRARSEPLQYILGTQPFGELEIKCRSGVLIPRLDTETYTTELARFLMQNAALLSADQERQNHSWRIADFCTGSGCIALLLHSLLKPLQATLRSDRPPPSIRAYDISEDALKLARENLQHNMRYASLHQDAARDVTFEHVDVLSLPELSKPEILLKLFPSDTHSARRQTFDVIVSNPPYISPNHFKPGGSTSKSVRKYEPRLALVPPDTCFYHSRHLDQADQFYAALLRIAFATDAKLLVMEVGDAEQAKRVRELARKRMERRQKYAGKGLIEIWKDDNSVVPDEEVDIGLSFLPGVTEAQPEDEQAECRVVAIWFDAQWIDVRRQWMKQPQLNVVPGQVKSARVQRGYLSPH